MNELQKFRSIGQFAANWIRRNGPVHGTELARELREKQQFDPKNEGYRTLTAFLERYAPELKIVSHSGQDVVWGLPQQRETRREEEHGSDNCDASTERNKRSRLDVLLSDAQQQVERNGEEEFVRQFVSAVEEWLNSPDPSDGTPEGFYRKPRSRSETRRIGACFLRLLPQVPHLFDRDRNLRVYAATTLDTLPDVYKRFGLSTDQQNYEKFAALRSCVDRVDRYLEERIAHLSDLDGFHNARENFMRGLKNDLVAALYGPFLPRTASQDAGRAFKVVQAYLDALPAARVPAYEEACGAVSHWRQSVAAEGTTVSDRFLRRPAEDLLKAVEEHFDSGPFSKPGQVAAHPVDKRYPLAKAGAEISLGFEIESIGTGPAIDVQASAEADPQRVELLVSTRLLGDLTSGTRLGPVDFTARVLSGAGEPLPITLRLEWTNADGSRTRTRERCTLESQSPDIPWEKLRAAPNPYSLDPIENEEDLIGRNELLAQLEASIRAKTVGSFWVHGQKRVGKTSIVRTLQNRILKSEEDFLVIYLLSGEFIHPDAEATVDTLGKRLCEEIQDADHRFAHLPIPDFGGALSPLDRFLRQVKHIDDSIRILFILDELDELPINLYRLGDIGNAFFLALRTISGKRPFGFVLVGGERMKHIVGIQGDHLNRFAPLAVDYFDHEAQYSDFEDLVRTPVAPWCTITDLAVSEVFSASAGNPFFAKWICSTMYKDVIRRSDAYVTEREMRLAISVAAKSAGSNQFQHFWKDGIFEISNERIEERMMLRRYVLLAFADLLRMGADATRDAILQRTTSHYGVSEADARTELQDLLRRDVLRVKRGMYVCKVGLFEKWLVERGVKDIVTSFADESVIIEHKRNEEDVRVSSEEVVRLVGTWGVYRGAEIGEERVRAWLNQYKHYSDQRLMFELLEGVRFYSAAAVRSKLREIHSSVKAELAAGKGAVRRQTAGALKTTDNVVVTAIEGAGKSGPHMQRLYVNENNIYTERAVAPNKLATTLQRLDDIHGIVIIDDFIGTGLQAGDGLDKLLARHAGIIRERDLAVFFGWVSGFSESAERVAAVGRKHGVEVITRIGDPLDGGDRCFSEESRTFPDPAGRQRAWEIAVECGRSLDERRPLGYGDCQATIVFEDSCPNNSLPILWKSTNEWMALFPRH